MKEWLAEYWIKSEIAITPGRDRLKFQHPKGSHRIYIRGARAEAKEDCDVVAQIVVSAPTIAEASDVAKREIRAFFDLMGFVCSMGFRVGRRVGIIEASRSAFMREAHVNAAPYRTPKPPLLRQELLETAQLFESAQRSPVLERALRWYANAAATEYMEDQFQYFWFTVELIATAESSTEKVTDKCQRCSGDLLCSSCGKLSTHRPFQKQKISALMQAAGAKPDQIDLLFGVRNRLLHGDHRDAIEAHIAATLHGYTFERAVNIIGRIAWNAIMKQFRFDGGEYRPELLMPNTYVDKQLMLTAHVQLGVQFDPDDLSRDCSPFAGFRAEIVDGEGDPDAAI